MILNDLKNQIITYLNESNLAIDGIYYVMREVMQEVEATYNQVLQQEMQAKMQEITKADNQSGPIEIVPDEEEKNTETKEEDK